MKIKWNGYEVCISAKSSFVKDEAFTDERACEVINQMICIMNLLEQEYKKSENKIEAAYANVLRHQSDDLFDQLEERGFYDEFCDKGKRSEEGRTEDERTD